MVKTLAAVAAVLGFLLIAPAHSAAISGIGARSCSQFSADIADASDGFNIEARYYAWAQGWMSRLNVDRELTGASYIADGQIKGPGLDVGPEQKAFLRSYCARNTSELYARGAAELYLAIMRARGLSV